ncbi:SRPBCC family protein [Melittangium boletus]|uniref:Polyketide cyclase n=1 Tax=Melittangium boletus DSM 14713 TaxID=1294270 RepID=A0A250IBM4_9BACT|nr:SRPBCC family protein [Melittangium boletus]ATB28572.1 hypothetical protein MEBOL_002021 [Melittangium boletus DSM 14713]
MLKKILISFGSLLGFVLVLGFVLPSTYRVERSTLLRAPAEAVYPHVADPRRWRAWVPWHEEHYPDGQWAFGSTSGAGAVRSWSGERVGRGTLSLSEAEPSKGVAYVASLDGGRFRARGRISFTSSEDGTLVTWVDEGEVGGNPFLHYLVPLVEARLGRDFERALAQLHRVVEADAFLETEVKPEPAAPPEQAAVPLPTAEPEPVPPALPEVSAPLVQDAGVALDAGMALDAGTDADADAGMALDAGTAPVPVEPSTTAAPTSAEPSLPAPAQEDGGTPS